MVISRRMMLAGLLAGVASSALGEAMDSSPRPVARGGKSVATGPATRKPVDAEAPPVAQQVTERRRAGWQGQLLRVDGLRSPREHVAQFLAAQREPDPRGIRQRPARAHLGAVDMQALAQSISDGGVRLQGLQADIDRVTAIWRECLQRYGGPYLFGKTPTTADAMYTPVCSRFATYDVKLDPAAAAYRDLMLRFPAMLEWTAAAKAEPEEVEELDVEF